ncbi:glutathione S-transferase family protein [Salaquimonas pukyongi]|uniref:glutathione S-transferase family protein n=1 Tax=Salaquimonas pukyongi TaxID=2712698 RepID=UPI00096B9A27|nr:glutathione S-transferase family protein [Salaquimonas pukyongi]
MGMLVDGKWQEDNLIPKTAEGAFKRNKSTFRNWVTADGSPGPDGEGGFAAQAGRYHLYVSYACPWAHRTLILRKLKRLEDMISLSVVDWFMGTQGWQFSDRDGAIADPEIGATHLHQIYSAAKSDYTGRVTVPVLWDRERKTIVSNESSEIIRMFNSAFDVVGAAPGNYYPAEHAAEIDALNERIYHTVNNGVYKCGFATKQGPYETAFGELFETLDAMEERLSNQRYLVGSQLTEADIRFFPTLVRFDAVYVGHFKCNRQRIADYPNLSNYLRDIYQHPGIAETVNLHHIKNHYYQSHETVNPTRIVPLGPKLDFDAPHNRERFSRS